MLCDSEVTLRHAAYLGGLPMRRVAIVVIALAAASCSLHSGRIHVLGRDYQKSGLPVSLADAQRDSAGALVVVNHGRVVSGSVGLNVPTVIYVENSDRYTQYTLEGGP